MVTLIMATKSHVIPFKFLGLFFIALLITPGVKFIFPP
jgi:hypothetical protein